MEPLLTGEGLGDIKALNFGIAISQPFGRGKGKCLHHIVGL